jgi:hypothetical protein
VGRPSVGSRWAEEQEKDMKLSEKFKVRCLTIFVIIALLATFAIAAITNHTLVRKNFKGKWTISSHTADASGAEVIKADPQNSTLIYFITKLIIGCDANITVTFGANESSSAVTTIYFTLPFNVSSGPYVFDFEESPLQIGDANSAIVIDGSGAGDVYVFAEGFTEVAN